MLDVILAVIFIGAIVFIIARRYHAAQVASLVNRLEDITND